MTSETSSESSPPAPAEASTAAAPATDATRLREVRAVIERIRPAVQSDGGDVELIDVEADGTVVIRFHGACVGCPSSSVTLRMGIERSLREHVEGVTGVRAVE